MARSATAGDALLVRAVREQLGLTGAEAAGLLGVSVDSVRSWESGRRTVPAAALVGLRGLQDAMDEQVAALLKVLGEAGDEPVVSVEEGAGPLGWQLRVVARVSQVVPGVVVEVSQA